MYIEFPPNKILCRQKSKVKELLDQGANPNIPDAAGWYPLHEVAVSEKDSAVEIMYLLIFSPRIEK